MIVVAARAHHRTSGNAHIDNPHGWLRRIDVWTSRRCTGIPLYKLRLALHKGHHNWSIADRYGLSLAPFFLQGPPTSYKAIRAGYSTNSSLTRHLSTLQALLQPLQATNPLKRSRQRQPPKPHNAHCYILSVNFITDQRQRKKKQKETTI